MGRWGRLLLWFGVAGVILCSSSGAQEPFFPPSPPLLPVPSPWDPKVTDRPSGSPNPLGTEGPWLFTTCGASGRRGPTQAQCDRAYAGSGVVVSVGDAGPLKGVQLWRAPGPGRYMISAYGAAGGKGAQSHLPRAHGVFLSAIFSFGRGETLFILVGQQGADACPGVSCAAGKPGKPARVPRKARCDGGDRERPGVAALGGRGRAGAPPTSSGYVLPAAPLRVLRLRSWGYLAPPGPQPLSVWVNTRHLPSNAKNGHTGFPMGRASSPLFRSQLPAVRQLCPYLMPTPSSCVKPSIAQFLGGDASATDISWADGEDGVSFIHPRSELYLQPLAVTESHGEVEIRRHPNCSHCPLKDCQWQAVLQLAACVCPEGMELAVDNITCMDLPRTPSPLVLMVAVTAALTVSLLMVCGVLILVSQKKWPGLWGRRLWDLELELSKLQTSALRTAPNSYYCQVGQAQSWPFGLPEVSPANVTLLSALGQGAFGEVYQGLVTGLPGEPSPLRVAVKALRKLCSPWEELDFLMEVHIISKLCHQNIVRCVGLSFRAVPRLILLELMSGGDMRTFLTDCRPHLGKPSPLAMQDLLQLAWDIAQGCHYLEENHFIHRDIAARNCLLSCTGPGRVAKIGDFGMAREIYRDSYYRRGGPAFLPVKWMPPEALLEGIFTSKTDSWSFGVLLWEIFSLGYVPYPGRTNMEVLDFVTAGSRLDAPRGCPGPVYRIMTQCWQHQPELRPSFASILQHLQYCTQDPDVLNSPLPVTLGPTLEEGASELGNRSLEDPRSP
ncbi:Leukocyte tyrosine kinase receptor [Heterocephalus glaber]|uniref:receptor protein-tyrosine kinase n=1 Tax=Heterocephalus glaber TaxID=10181 RepID=G5BM16_HETGA|nr:Leukocyte tyrosine kinase receptor [Heterocephalus glaber]